MKKQIKYSLFALTLASSISLAAIGDDAMESIGGSIADGIDSALNANIYAPSEDFSEVDFNFDWKFQLGESGSNDEISTTYDDSSWRNVTLPHDWSVEQDFNANIPAAMGMLPAGQGWYRKSFTLDTTARNKEVYINFDGVYMDSDVYVNGVHVGNYPYGYTPFSYNITPYLNAPGEENIIAVRIDSPLGNGHNSSRWYAGAGINRNVTLSFEEPTHIENDGVYFTNELEAPIDGHTANSPIQKGATALELAQAAPKTTDVATTVAIDIRNNDDTVKKLKAKITYTDYNTGAVIDGATFETDTFNVDAHSYITHKYDFVMPTIHLWDIDDPYLYNIITEVIDADTNEVIDRTVTRYGYKKQTYTLNDGYYLNGRYIKLAGACMHPDQGALGNVSDYDAVNRQIRKLKEMGINTIRTAHCPFSDTFMRACDEQGILVFEEWYDTWTYAKNSDDYHLHFNVEVPTDENHPLVKESDTWKLYDLRMTLRRDRNCPSVIMYSIGNEIGGTGSNSAYVGYAEEMIAEVRANDPDTPVTMGFPMWSGDGTATRNEGSVANNIADRLDIVGFNYPSAGSDYDTSHNNFDWIVFGSETASAWKSRGYFRNSGGSMEGVTQQEGSLDYTTHFKSMQAEWVDDRDRKQVLGQYIWTGFDYIGEPQPYDGGSDPSKSSYYGSIDTAGFEKAEFYMLKSQWVSMEQDPFVKVVNHVNLDDDNLRKQITTNNDSETVELWVSSNATSVRLTYVNDDGSETEIDFKDWNQSVNPKNDSNRLQVPLDNPSKYANQGKLYQVFQIDWDTLQGKDVRAYAYDKPSADVDIATDVPIATDKVNYSNGSQTIRLTPETSSITADGHALSYITVDVTDYEGNINPNAMDEMTFSIKGDGEIVGVDNGDPYGKEKYKYLEGETWKRSAFNGKALVIVRSTTNEGSFTLTAQGKGLTPTETTVFTTAEGSSVVNYAAETTSLAIASGSTVAELREALPATVTIKGSDGSTASSSVEWNTETIKDTALVKNNTFFIYGTVAEYSTVQAKCMVTVSGDIEYTAQRVALNTIPNTIPELPSEIGFSGSDGSTITAPVTWYDYQDPSMYVEGASINIGGIAIVEGEEYPVLANVSVVSEDDYVQDGEINVLNVSASYQEGVHHADQVIDGTYDNDNGWGNWYQFKTIRSNDYLEFTFAPSTIDSFDVYFLEQFGNGDEHAYALPTDLKIEYLNELDTYVEVTNVTKPASLKTIDWNQNTNEHTDKANTFTFDPVRTTKLRITFNVDEAAGDYNGREYNHYANNKYNGSAYTMMKVSEVDIFGDYYNNLPNEAIIGDVWMNGVKFEDFDFTVYNYTIGVENGDTAPILSANGLFGATVRIEQAGSALGTAYIYVTSADYSTTVTYTFTFYIMD